uniref:Uncharacterized protein n=1 Tax=Vespula pensylvanica TaxID=30213 RepID=A0A834UHL0_VESPE|nr:hypothetical protein H0235_001670 [Vespula pensylvanica]
MTNKRRILESKLVLLRGDQKANFQGTSIQRVQFLNGLRMENEFSFLLRSPPPPTLPPHPRPPTLPPPL